MVLLLSLSTVFVLGHERRDSLSVDATNWRAEHAIRPAVVTRAAAGLDDEVEGAAVYGPVRTVVWEGRSREAPPYPD